MARHLFLHAMILSASLFGCAEEDYQEQVEDACVWHAVATETAPGVWDTSFVVEHEHNFDSICASANTAEDIVIALNDVTSPDVLVILGRSSGNPACLTPQSGALFDLFFEAGHRYRVRIYSDVEPVVTISVPEPATFIGLKFPLAALSRYAFRH